MTNNNYFSKCPPIKVPALEEMSAKPMSTHGSRLFIGSAATLIACIGFLRNRCKPTRCDSPAPRTYVFYSSEGTPLTLTGADISNIKTLVKSGIDISTIASRYQTSPVMVSRIINTINKDEK